MSLARTILPVVDPRIGVDPLYMEDQESAKADRQRNPAVPDWSTVEQSARAGAWVPIVAVRSIMFQGDDLRQMTLSVTGRVPRLSVTVRDTLQKFAVNFPLDGDVVSVYLRPPDKDNQRPVRIDFDIVSVRSSPTTQTYTFTGVMKVPGMFGEVCRSFGRNTSFEHLADVAEELGLGFASNVTRTDDAMTRVCPYETYETFVRETVAGSYLDDDSFFTWYVDPYYYLTLVEVNRQFSLADETEDVNLSYAAPFAGVNGFEGAPDTIKGSLVLTNMAERAGMNNFIESFSLENSSAGVWINNGYRRTAQYYDVTADAPEYVTSFVEPLTTAGAENDFILLRGRPDEDRYKRLVKYKWLGRQHAESVGGNVHDNYLFAHLLNHQNMAELGKTVLKVNLAGMNFYVQRYSRVPVLIYNPSSNPKNSALLKQRDEDLGETADGDPDREQGINKVAGGNPDSGGDGIGNPGDQVKNEFLTGYYVVAGVEYRYTAPGPVKQSLTLVRREWPIPARNKDV